MASVSEVKAYLAYWFQLGKPVASQNDQTACLPGQIFQGNQYSDDFEQCWQQISQDTSDCHLQGTDQTIGDLLTGNWEITACARCTMPIPMPVGAVSTCVCPCYDLPTWPNNEVPLPRVGVSNSRHLGSIRDRLSAFSDTRDRLQATYTHSPNLLQPDTDRDQLESHQEATRATGS